MEQQTVQTMDENGNEVNFQLIDVVNYDDQDYALLLPEGVDETSEDAELVLMRLVRDGEECTFEVIEDDDEFDLVSQAIIDAEEDYEED